MTKNKYYISGMIGLFAVLVIMNMIDTVISNGTLKHTSDIGYILAYCMTMNVLGISAIENVFVKNMAIFTGLFVILIYGILRIVF